MEIELNGVYECRGGSNSSPSDLFYGALPRLLMSLSIRVTGYRGLMHIRRSFRQLQPWKAHLVLVMAEDGLPGVPSLVDASLCKYLMK